MTRCFEDYVIPATFTPALLSFLIRVDAADLVNTVVAVDEGKMAGILLVCRRGHRMRVGAIAVAKPHRSQGLGGELMARALVAAKDRGELHVVLEAIEHNNGAIRFYERHGFKVLYRLVPGQIVLAGRGKGKISEISLAEMSLHPFLGTEAADCWELNSASVGNMAHPIAAYAFEDMSIAVAPRGEEGLVCYSLALSGKDDERKLRSLLAGLASVYPRRIFRVPPYYPEPMFRALLESAGMDTNGLSQVQMELKLG